MDAVELKPGQPVKVPGQYRQFDPQSGELLGGEATLSSNDVAPPTERKGLLWRLVDPSQPAGKPGQFVYTGEAAEAEFEALPGVVFRPGEPVTLSAEQARIAQAITLLRRLEAKEG